MAAGTSAESLFRDLFLPLYPEDVRGDLARARSEDANPVKNPSFAAHLDDAAGRFVGMAPTVLGVAESKLELDYSDASVHRLSAALTPEIRDRLAKDGERGTPKNALFNVVVHGAAYVGACVVRQHGGSWAIRRPLWESLVHLKSRAGEGDLPVFHWWLKALADDPTATLADRYRAYVEIPRATPESLPIIAPPDRKLPRIAKPSYHALHQYVRAHLVEIRDLGDDFPSPERFAELGFKSLNFALVGEGRMLVAWGPTEHGLHAIWMTKEGFDKSAFWPADKFPEPLLRVRGEGPSQKLEVVLSKDEKPVAIELLWWGP